MKAKSFVNEGGVGGSVEKPVMPSRDGLSLAAAAVAMSPAGKQTNQNATNGKKPTPASNATGNSADAAKAAQSSQVVIPKECSYLDPSNDLVTPPQAAFDKGRRPATISAPTEIKTLFPGDTSETTALQQAVTVGNKTVNVIYPKGNLATDPNTTLATSEQIKGSLSVLPDETLGSISKVVISPNQNPDDAYWEKEYKMPGFRSAATGGDDGVVTYYPSTFQQPQSDIDRIMAHEAGHTYSIPNWQQNPDQKATWEKAVKSDPTAPSKYAQALLGEDFSESHAMYIASKGTPCEATAKALYPNRYVALEKIYTNG